MAIHHFEPKIQHTFSRCTRASAVPREWRYCCNENRGQQLRDDSGRVVATRENGQTGPFRIESAACAVRFHRIVTSRRLGRSSTRRLILNS